MLAIEIRDYEAEKYYKKITDSLFSGFILKYFRNTIGNYLWQH